MQILVAVLVLLLAPVTWAHGDEVDDESLEPIEDCAVFGQEVSKRISGQRECWTDADCERQYLGCPWQRYPCQGTIIGTSEREKLNALRHDMARFGKYCVLGDPEMKAHCEVFVAREEGRKCDYAPRVMCLDGQCATEGNVLLLNQKFGDKDDFYKKKEFLYVIDGDEVKVEEIIPEKDGDDDSAN